MPQPTVTQLEKEILYCTDRADALQEIADSLQREPMPVTVTLDCGGQKVLAFDLCEVIDPPLSFDLLRKLEYCFRQRVYAYEAQLKQLKTLRNVDGSKNRLTA